ncbi:MAG: exodeoxyribonuclease I [Cardiobacteriaceae bacterium]|nr:exodeoxyribonuclease I [Cardiobacteriaceae bacterium]
MESFFVYDYECFGLDAARDGVAQWAGVRLNQNFEPIEEAQSFYCKPSVDYLPNPDSVLLTGITPQYCAEYGLLEPFFIARILEAFEKLQTCVMGYNNIRYDDEFTRYLAYRNFHDPYAYSYANGNSRWDLLDVVRATYALRPEGLSWAYHEDGMPSFRLEDLTAANDLTHSKAHDALSDVWATVGLLQLLHRVQPRLLAYALTLRSKKTVQTMLNQALWQPLVHVSGMFGAMRSYMALVVPLAQHPSNQNAWIVCDLGGEVEVLADYSVLELKEHLFSSPSEQSALDERVRVPLKLIHTNKCPFIAPLKTLRSSDAERLSFDMGYSLKNMEKLKKIADLQEKVKALYEGEWRGYEVDKPAREQLYAGFLEANDKALCREITQSAFADLGKKTWHFQDARLPALLLDYRARYAFHTLTRREQLSFQTQVRQKLETQILPYSQRLQELAQSPDLNEKNFSILQQLYEYGVKKSTWQP